MNLRLLRELNTHESRTELITALDKLKWLFINKARDVSDKDKKVLGGLPHATVVLSEDGVWLDYLNELGIETKFGPMPYKDGPDFINISINVFEIKWPNQWHIKVPVDIAERILVLGMP